ncbi:MAG TPA: cytochrome b N-terminal domain-containing protein [Gemmatimonadales bacterium]|nr:cytochrome b N-terminal domain-containing protein [Gemmatimonadales bacterium]
MASLFRWLDERVNLRGAKRDLLDREVPDRLTWWHTLGSATLTVFLVQLITGVTLATYYSSSPDHAYESIQFINRQVASGMLLRGIHHWGASAMVVLIIAHVIRVFAVGAYKYPREINWLVGVGLLVVVLAFSFTGYLLPWDQKAYWATAVGTNIAGTTPLLGGALVALLRGGSELGAATLARFYAFHALWLPLLLTALMALHIILVVRQGIAARPKALEDGAPGSTADPAYPAYYRGAYAATKRGGQRFWPDVLGKDAIVSAVVVIAIFALGAALGAPLEAPADPTDTTYIPRPEWYFLPIYQLLKLVPGSFESAIAVGVPTALLLALVCLPFFDRGSTRNLLHRPLALASLVFILAGSGFLIGAAGRAPQPKSDSSAALSSVERAGRALYQSQQCGGCHRIAGEGGDIGPDLSDVGARHSAGWIHSFIELPSRFHAESRMPAYGPPTLSHQEIEELAQYLSSLEGAPGHEPHYYDSFPAPRSP